MRGIISQNINDKTKFFFNYWGDYSFENIVISDDKLLPFIEEKNYEFIHLDHDFQDYLSGMLDYLGPIAEITGTIDTIYNQNDFLVGFNASYFGYIDLFNHHNIDINKKIIVILGSGGKAETLKYLLSQKTNNVIVVNNDPKVGEFSYGQFKIFPKIDILVNTEATGKFNSSVNLFKIYAKPETVIDIPCLQGRSPLLVQAQSLKCKAYNGLRAKVGTAAYTYKIINKNLENFRVDSAYARVKGIANMVLIGMDNNTKTHVAEVLVKNFEKQLIDTKLLIEESEGLSYLDIIENYGLDHYYNLESNAIEKLTGVSNSVIITSDGVVDNYKNIQKLQAAGRIYYLNAPEKLFNINNDKNINQLYLKRKNVFMDNSDIRINYQKNDIDAISQAIINEFENYKSKK